VKKRKVFLTFTTIILLLLSSCTTFSGSTPGGTDETEPISTVKLEAVEFPELILTRRDGSEERVKLLSLQGRMVTVTPFPYWAVELETLAVDQISSLKYKRYTYPGLTWTLGSAECGFIAVGSILGAFAETKGEYNLTSILSYVSACVMGGYIFITETAYMGEAVYPEYLLAWMNEKRKLKTIRKIMGIP
jgi:hypothetical protein